MRGDLDPLPDLEEFWIHAEPGRVLRQAGVPARVNRDLLQVLIVLAREVRDLRQALLVEIAPGGERRGREAKASATVPGGIVEP